MKVLPTLTTDGFITNNDLIITKLFEYFLTSDYSQSETFYNNIASLPYLIRTAGSDFDMLEDLIKDTLSKMYGRFYGACTVDVNIKDEADSNGKTIHIIDIDVAVITEDNESLSLVKSINVVDNNINTMDRKLDYFLGA